MTVATSGKFGSSPGWAQANPAPFMGHPASRRVAALGVRGYDGISIDWKQALGWSLSLGDLAERLEQNGVLELVSTAAAAGRPQRRLTTVTLKRIGPAFHLACDFGPIGASCAALEIRREGRTVATLRGVTDTIAVIEGGGGFSPRLSHELTGFPGPTTLTATLAWSRPAAIRIAHSPAWAGDELIARPEHPPMGRGIALNGTVCLQTGPALKSIRAESVSNSPP